MSASKKLIILDRDGVINFDSASFIRAPEEWIPIPKSLEAIAQLNQAGYRVAVATNQSGLGRGFFDIATLNAIHTKMHRAAAAVGARIDAIFFCPHTGQDNCQCRKPKPGLLNMILERFDIEPTLAAHIPFVGDALRDLEAATAAGITPHLVLTGKGMLTQKAPNLPANVTIHNDLFAFALHILGNTKNNMNQNSLKNTNKI